MNEQELSHLLAETGMGRQAKKLWPAIKGSLAKVHKPCIRKNCPLCESGEKHPAWILSVSRKGRRSCLYVPEELVPVIRRAIQNGRWIEEWLSNQGPEIVKAFRVLRNSAGEKTKPTAKS